MSNDKYEMMEDELKIEMMLKQLQETIKKQDASPWMGIDELRNYLPSRPARITIYRMIESGKLKAKKIGRKYYWHRDEIDKWLEEGTEGDA